MLVVTGDGPGAETEEPRATEGVDDSVRRRLGTVPRDTWRSWAATAWVVAIAAILRFVHLGLPNRQVFDEVYYANEGQQMLDHGVEWRTEYDSAGHVTASFGDYVVHPPLGKWIIAAGIKVSQGGWARPFGYDAAYGWRFAGAVCGTLAVLMITRIGRRMFRSTVLGCVAGLLMALDGFELVLSRIAILDIFVLFFALAAFGCVLLDRDQRRRRWLRAIEQGLDPTRNGRAGRPRFGWDTVPWWRLAAGVMLGAGCAVKWSVIWYVPLFMLLILWWEAQLRRTVGAPHPWRDALLDEIGWIAAMGVLVLATYLASWTGWFITDTGWKRHYLRDQLGRHEYPILGALQNLYYYHREMLSFHDGLISPHPYQSWPWQWLILGRPVAFYWSGDPNCGGQSCAAEILLLGTPALWWAFLPALFGTAWFGIARRDWRALPIWIGALAGIAPWFLWEISDRTMFYFYAAPAEPFLILAVVYVLGCLATKPGLVRVREAVGFGSGFGSGAGSASGSGLGERLGRNLGLGLGRFGFGPLRYVYDRRGPMGGGLSADERRLYGTIAGATFVLIVGLCFWYFFPLYVGNSITNQEWGRRLLLGERWR
jgi:dolichyl-phosphate-mannose-protein mannosyltransferase